MGSFRPGAGSGIFTGTSISPDVLSRQRPNHYAFRAGRNLPDKEFRYLRTVIVTAAVYWGLSSWLRFLTTPLNLPAPGRRQPIYLTFRFCIDLCVLLNSCLGLFSAACSREHPFSRSYGVILPSSLTILLPPALGFSPHPPVSVYGTGHNETIAAFLDGLLNSFPTLFRSASHLRLMRGIFLPHIYCACTGFLIPGSVLPSVSLQFCSLRVQESQPAVHRLRISASP